MKQNIILYTIIVLMIASSLKAQSNQELSNELEELSNLVETMETKTLSDKIKFTPELRLRMDKFSYKNRDNSKQLITTNTSGTTGTNADSRGESGDAFNKEWKPHYSVRLRFNMSTNVVESVKFTGRMVITHNSQNRERLCILSRSISANDQISNTTFDMDKAYLDWLISKSIIISAGILPTSGGLSSNIIEDTSRKSVFPSLMFDMTTYGLAASYTPGANIWFRGVVAKAYTRNGGQYYYQCNRETIYNTDVIGAFVEAKIPYLPNNTTYIGLSRLANIIAIPYLGSSSAAIDMKYANPMGSINNIGTGIEVRNILNRVDFFIHLAMNQGKSSDEYINFTDIGEDNIGNINGENLAFTSDNYARGYLNEDNGYGVYIGTKITLPMLNYAKIGFEYNQGSKYWFSGTQGAEDIFNKLATRGTASEIYYIQPINRIISVRFGYLKINEQWTGSGWHFGTPAAKNGTQTNLYAIINAYF